MSDNKIVNFIEKYEGVKPVILVSKPGVGKTYTALQWASENYEKGNIFRINGSNTMEAFDYLGMYVRVGDGMEYVDGALVAAFRRAAAGNKVFILFDEIGRIPAREKDNLIAILSPDNKNNYVVTTNKGVKYQINGSSGIRMESIEAPANNITFVGTTNAGGDYNIERGDPAFNDRFRFMYVKRNLLNELDIASNLFPDKSNLINLLFDVDKVLAETIEVKDIGTRPLSLRHIIELLKISSDQTELKRALVDLIPTIVNETPSGVPDPEAVNIFAQIINQVISTDMEEGARFEL
jgi:midasin (ATPase involved in ribosome maturation)